MSLNRLDDYALVFEHYSVNKETQHLVPDVNSKSFSSLFDTGNELVRRGIGKKEYQNILDEISVRYNIRL